MEPLKVSDILKMKQGDTLELVQKSMPSYNYKYEYFSRFQGRLYVNGTCAREWGLFEFEVQIGQVWYSIEDEYIYGDFGKKIDKPIKIYEINPESVLGFHNQPFYIKPKLKAKL